MEDIVEKAFGEVTAGQIFFNAKGKGQPRLLIMSGLPMSGKSYLSNMISEKMQGKVCIVRTDSIRPTVAKLMGRDQPMYTKNEHALVFGLGNRLIAAALDNGWSVIADATNLTDQYRKWAYDAGANRARQTLVAFLDIPLEIAMERVKEKDRDGSAATPAVYALMRFDKEPIDRCSNAYVVINSEVDIRPWADVLAKWLSAGIENVAGTVMPAKSSQSTKVTGRLLP